MARSQEQERPTSDSIAMRETKIAQRHHVHSEMRAMSSVPALHRQKKRPKFKGTTSSPSSQDLCVCVCVSFQRKFISWWKSTQRLAMRVADLPQETHSGTTCLKMSCQQLVCENQDAHQQCRAAVHGQDLRQEACAQRLQPLGSFSQDICRHAGACPAKQPMGIDQPKNSARRVSDRREFAPVAKQHRAVLAIMLFAQSIDYPALECY